MSSALTAVAPISMRSTPPQPAMNHSGYTRPLSIMASSPRSLLSAVFVEMRAAWRLLRLFFHVLKGLAIVRFQVPRMSMTELGLFKQRWGKQLLDILAVRLQAECSELPERAMIVCNHISWLDIAVIHAVTPAHFVCKKEVLDWPCVGWFVAATKTIFISRSSRKGAAKTARALAERLAANERVAFFPEGTTTNGMSLLPFNAALFEAATPAQAWVIPMRLRYLDTTGKPTTAPAYDGDISFAQCLNAIIKCPAIVADLKVLSPIPHGLERREYAQLTRQQIARELGLD